MPRATTPAWRPEEGVLPAAANAITVWAVTAALPRNAAEPHDPSGWCAATSQARPRAEASSRASLDRAPVAAAAGWAMAAVDIMHAAAGIMVIMAIMAIMAVMAVMAVMAP